METTKPRPTTSETTVATSVTQAECLEAPSIIDGRAHLDEDEERVEAFMYAFNSISKGYFQQKNNIEDSISQKTLERTRASKYYYLGSALVALSVILTLALTSMFALSLAGVGIVEIILVYWKQHILGSKIAVAREELQLLKIDKKITFVSKLYLPVYLAPYRQGVMIFDSLGKTPTEELHLDNLEGEELMTAFDRLRQTLSNYELQFSDKGIFTVEEVQAFHPEVVNDRFMEKPIVSSLKEILEISAKLEPHIVSLNIYRPETSFADSVHQLFMDDLVRPRMNAYDSGVASLPLVETRYDFESVSKAIEDIRGMRTQAQEQDIVSSVRSWLDEVQKSPVLDSARERLRQNIANVDRLFKDVAEEHKTSIFDVICEECARSQHEGLGGKYKLFTTFEEYLGDARAGFETLEDHKHLEEYEQQLQRVAEEVDMDVPDDVIYGLVDFKNMKLRKEEEQFRCPSCLRKGNLDFGVLAPEVPELVAKGANCCSPTSAVGQSQTENDRTSTSMNILNGAGVIPQVLTENVQEQQPPHVGLSSVLVPSYLSVFARTASTVFDYLKTPVIDSLKVTSKEINQHYLSIRSQLLALLPLYDMIVQLKVKSEELDSAISEAKSLQAILRSLR